MYRRTRRAVLDSEIDTRKAAPLTFSEGGRELPRAISFYNKATEAVPQYAVLSITDAERTEKNPTNILTCEKPSSSSKGAYAVNGFHEVVKNGGANSRPFGICHTYGNQLILYTGTAPETGDMLGPVNDQWYASASGSPLIFKVLGVVDETNKIALVRIGSSASLTPFILYDDVAPGDTDKYAWPVKDDEGDLVADEEADKVYLQNTYPGNFRGYGSSHSGFSTTTAAKVLVADLFGKKQIVGGKGLAKMIRGSGPGTTVAASATFTLTLTAVLDDGHSPSSTGSPTGGTLTVTNWATALPASATGIVCCADGSGGYFVIDAPCP